MKDRQTDGEPVILYRPTHGANQRFTLTPAPKGTVIITARHSDKVLQDGGRATRARAVVQQWSRREGALRQRWSLVPVAGAPSVPPGAAPGGCPADPLAPSTPSTPVPTVTPSAPARGVPIPMPTSSATPKPSVPPATPSPVPSATVPSASLLGTLVADMTGVNDTKPHGVPDSVGWNRAPRVGMGNDPGNWTAMVPWGQVYASTSGSPATNTRVELRDIRAFLLSKSTGRWKQVVSSMRVEGSAFREDFAGDVSVPADLRDEPDGGRSVRLVSNHNFHFWSPNRATIDPQDVGGIVVTVQARLVVDDPRKADDRASARILAGAGGDYWANLDARWDNWKTNGDFAIGKLKFVHEGWDVFSASTLDGQALRKNPPPLP